MNVLEFIKENTYTNSCKADFEGDELATLNAYFLEMLNKIAELEKANNILKQPIDLGNKIIFTKESLGVLKLEQQAIGAYESVWFCKFEGVRTDEQPNRHISHLLNARVKELRNQAKALKSEPKVSLSLSPLTEPTD